MDDSIAIVSDFDRTRSFCHITPSEIITDDRLNGYCMINSTITDVMTEIDDSLFFSACPFPNKYYCAYCEEEASFHFHIKDKRFLCGEQYFLCEEHGRIALLDLAIHGWRIPDLAEYREEQIRLYQYFFGGK